MREMG
jgi:hypothetical protein